MWHGNLTQEQCNNIERIQKRALRIIHPEHKYNEALKESKLKLLKERRNDLCIDLIKNMLQPTHNLLHGLLPDKHSNIKMRETRANSNTIYNFFLQNNVLNVVPQFTQLIDTTKVQTRSFDISFAIVFLELVHFRFYLFYI